MKPLLLLSLLAASAAMTGKLAAAGAPLPIAPLTRATPVDFEEEVMPFLRDNCVSCHCKTTTKGALNLETPELIIKGGDTGPGLTPGKSADSLLLQAAAHLDEDLKMPPRDNKAKAKNLNPNQLALLKLWIDQGAKPSPKREKVIVWQPLPENVTAILAVAVTPDGQFAACARANRLSFYHLPSGRTLSTEVGHRDQVNALAASPDGSLFASGSYREVKLWRRVRDEQKLQLADAGTTVAISPDGKKVATGREDGSVKLWSLPDGKLETTLPIGKAAVRSVKFSPDGAKLACALAGKSIVLWHIADAKQLAAAETPAEVNAVAWVGDTIAAGGADGIIRVWDNALANPKEMPGHKDAVTALDALPTLLVSGGTDGTVRLWDVEKGKSTIQMAHGAPVTSVSIRPDGKRIASAGANNLAKLWDAAGKAAGDLKGDRYAQEFALARERALQVATGTVAFRKTAADNADKQLKAAQERVKKSVEAVPAKKQEVEPKQKAVATAREAKAAADKALADADAELKKATEAADAAEKTAAQAKTAAEELKAKTPPDQPAIDKASAELAEKTKAFDKAKAERDQRTAQRKQAADKLDPLTKALADAEDALKKAETGVTVAESEIKLAGEEEQKTTAALAAAKADIETAENARKKADEEVQAARKAATESEKPIRAIVFSPDGQTVATTGDDMLIHTWNAETGAAFEVFKGSKTAVTALAFAPGGQLVSTAQDSAAVVWDIVPVWKFDRLIGTSEGKSPFVDRIQALAFSPDGKFLAIGGGEPSRGGEIKLWDIQSGNVARDLPNLHSDAVLTLDFSADGKCLASGAADKIVRVTDLGTGKVVKSFEGHTHHVLGLSWSLDGRTLATAGADNVAKIWDFTTGDRKKNVEGYDKEVTSIRFLGTGEQMFTTSGDNKVRILNAGGGDVRTLPEVADFMQAGAATADGKVILAGGQDSILRVWNAADGKPLGTFPAAAPSDSK
jgi:WD40 repeat protein